MDTGVGAGHVKYGTASLADSNFKTLPLRPVFQGDLCSEHDHRHVSLTRVSYWLIKRSGLSYQF